MNKLMVALSAVALAMGVQAAAMDWKVTVASGDKTKQFMFFDASYKTEVLAAMTDITGEDAWAGVSAYALASTKGELQFATTSKSASKTGTLVGMDKGSSIFYVLFDTTDAGKLAVGTTYKYSDNLDASAWIYNGDADPPESSPGTWALSAATQLTNTGTITAAVPEPTSAMLLLLGMAGLALKRRRA